MATQTTNYGLTKPSYNETADIGVINSNMDIIDAKMKAIENKAGSGGGGGASAWGDISDKPFESIGNGLEVDESGALNATGGGGTVDAYTKKQTDDLLLNKVDKEAGKGLFSGSYNDLTDAPTIPSKTSELENDSGYLTEHQDLSSYAKKTELNQALSNKADKATTLAGYGIIDGVTKTETDNLLSNKVDKVDGKGLSTNDYSTEEKQKLGRIEDGANKTTVDSALSSTSTNPVQNKVVTQAINSLQGGGVNNSVISDVWDNTTTYTVGQYCIYNNSLWKCLVQHNGQTPTEGTYWTKVSVADEISLVNNSLVATDGQKLYFDSKDGKYGYNTSPSRGADTFVPFRNAEVVYRDYTNSSATIDNDILFTNNTNAPITVTIAMIVSNTSSSYRYTQIAINGEVKNSYNSGNQIIHQALQSGDILSMNKQANARAEVYVITDVA